MNIRQSLVLALAVLGLGVGAVSCSQEKSAQGDSPATTDNGTVVESSNPSETISAVPEEDSSTTTSETVAVTPEAKTSGGTTAGDTTEGEEIVEVTVVEEEPKTEPADDKALQEEAVKVLAAKLAAEAQEDLNASRYNEAATKLRQALKYQPENKEYAEALKRAETQAANAGKPGLIGPKVDEFSIIRQRAIAEYNQAMDFSKKKLAEGRFAEAMDGSSMAKAILKVYNEYLGVKEREDMKLAADDLAATINEAYKKREDEAGLADQEEIKKGLEEAALLAIERKQNKIKALLARARELNKEMKYREALDHVDQVLFLDPNNLAAKFMKEMLNDNMSFRAHHRIRKEMNRQLQENSLLNLEQNIPYADLLMYPPDWPQITVERLGMVGEGAAESELNRAAREKLLQTIPVDFKAHKFEDVVEYLRNVTGANIFVNWRSLEELGITPDQQVTMKLQNVAAEIALKKILDNVSGGTGEVGFEVNDGIVEVGSRAFLARVTRAIRPYDIRDLIIHIPNYDDSPEFSLSAGVGGDTGGGGIFGDGGGESEPIDPDELIEQLQELIMNLVDREGWVDQGGDVSEMAIHGGTLLVTTTPANHRSIMQLLGMLRDQRALTISVESRFLQVDEGFLEDIGVNFNMWVDAPWTAGAIGFTQNPNLTQFTNAGSFSIPGAPTIVPQAGGGAPASAFGEVNTVTQSVFQGARLIIDDLTMSLLIRASQTDVRVVQVQTPRITLFNGQRAYVVLATQESYISSLEPVVADGAVAYTPEVSVLSTGVVLDVEGTISADRRYVTMNLRPSLAIRTINTLLQPGNSFTFQAGVGIASPVASVILPAIQITEVRTSASIPDKGTMLIGGLRRVVDEQREAGVPGLSKLPLLDRLFNNRSQVEEQRTQLVMVRPTIIIHSEQEEKLFPGLNESTQLWTTE